MNEIFIRTDFNNEDSLVCSYTSIDELIIDANRFYHEQFNGEEDYNEFFKIKSYKDAIEFWACNGYEIYKSVNRHFCNEANTPVNV